MSNSIASIGPDIIQYSTNLIGSLLKKHMQSIDKAYLKAPDSFAVSLKIKYKPLESGEIDTKAYIEFITDKVKDDVSGQMREGQEDLFSQKKGEPEKERLSHCNTTCLDCKEECQNFLCRRKEKAQADNVVNFEKKRKTA